MAKGDIIVQTDLSNERLELGTSGQVLVCDDTQPLGFKWYTVSTGSGDSGTSAWSGYSGYSGYSGTSGDSGTSGWSGCSGYSGASGAGGGSGASGYSGYSGTGTSGWSGYSGMTPTVVGITTDVTNSRTTFGNITGLSFSVLANKTYWFQFNIINRASGPATSGQCQLALSGPAFTNMAYTIHSPNSNTATVHAFASGWDIGPAATSSAAQAQKLCIIEGTLTPSEDGTLIGRLRSRYNSANWCVAYSGSWAILQQISE